MRDPGRAIRARVGTAIQRHRLLRRLTQERLAELARISGKHLGEIERGQMNLTLEILAQIADALGIDPAELLVPRTRRLSTALLISRDDANAMLDIAQRVTGVRATRSKRASS